MAEDYCAQNSFLEISDTNDGNDTTFLKLLAYMYIIRYTGTRKSYKITVITVTTVTLYLASSS